MRKLMRSPARPNSSSRAASLRMRPGRARSASATASPQVGMAGQAIAYLLAGEANLRAQLVDDLAQPCPGTDPVEVLNAAVLDVDPDVQLPIALIVPAEVVVDGLPRERLWGLQLE